MVCFVALPCLVLSLVLVRNIIIGSIIDDYHGMYMGQFIRAGRILIRHLLTMERSLQVSNFISPPSYYHCSPKWFPPGSAQEEMAAASWMQDS